MRLNNKEAPVVKAVLETFEHHRWAAIRINSGMLKIGDRLIRLAPKGTSDVIAIVPGSGRMMVVECKRPDGKGRATDAQLDFLAQVEDAGGVAMLLEDVRNLDRAIEILRADPYAKLDRDGRRRDLCEHGIAEGDWCPDCREDHRQAEADFIAEEGRRGL